MLYPYNNTKLTVELREIVESGVDLWDFDYPSYYEGQAKKDFERKVIDHYYFRQIGQETVGRFLHYFRTRVREIMPLYIQRYKSVALLESMDDPLQSYDLTEEFTQERVGTGNSTSQSESSLSGETSEASSDSTAEARERRFSNTPHGSIENLRDGHMSEASLENNTTDRSVDTSGTSSTDTSSSSTDTTESTEELKYTLTRKGNIGVAPLGNEINALRAAFINVDMEVINELNDLFLLTY